MIKIEKLNREQKEELKKAMLRSMEDWLKQIKREIENVEDNLNQLRELIKESDSRREPSERICKYCSNYIDKIMINEECCQVDGCPKFKDHNELGGDKNGKTN